MDLEHRLALLEARVDALTMLAAMDGGERLDRGLADIRADIGRLGQSSMKSSSNDRLASTVSSGSGSSTAPTTSGRTGM